MRSEGDFQAGFYDRRLMLMSVTNLTNYIEERCRLHTDMAPQGPALGYGSPSVCRVRKLLSTIGPAVSAEMFPPYA